MSQLTISSLIFTYFAHNVYEQLKKMRKISIKTFLCKYDTDKLTLAYLCKWGCTQAMHAL